MDDLIYILLGIAWIIYAAYRANQKQKKRGSAMQPSVPTSSPAVPEERTRPLDTIFREILGEGTSLEQVTFPESESYDEIAVKEMEKEKRLFGKPKTILETIPAEEGISAFDSKYDEDTRSFTAADEDHAFPVDHGENLFDLRKAVIYAEILNRPYR